MTDTQVTKKLDSAMSCNKKGKGNFIPTSAEHSINRAPLGHYIMPTYGRLKMYGLSTKVAASRLTFESHMQVVRRKAIQH